MSEIRDMREMRAEELKGLLEKQRAFSNLLITGTLVGINAARATFTNCTFMNCKITAGFFEEATFVNCSFYSCTIKLVDFTKANFTDCTFASRFSMCDFSYTRFTDSAFRRGYITNSQIDLTYFTKVTFDGIWAKNLIISGEPLFDKVNYTMGGARCDEVEVQRKLFFKAFEK